MAIDVPMPKLGLTMEEAMIIDWLVADGDVVETDQPIMLIETDKTETEVAAPGAGRVHQIGHPGDVFPCGELVGLLLSEGEEPPATQAPKPSVGSTAPVEAAAIPSAPASVASAPSSTSPMHHGGRVAASPNARRIAAQRGVALATVRGTGPGGRIVSEDVEAAPIATPVQYAPAGSAHAVASVAARNLADLLGVDLAQVPIDPVERRITRDTVAVHVRGLLQQLAGPLVSPPPAPPPPAEAAAAPLLQEPTSIVRMSGMRGTIAKRMHASLREMAQLTLTMDADMTEVLADRVHRKTSGTAPSITDYVFAASARALLRHPNVNAQITSDGIALLPEVHVGLAVAVEGGLMVPVVRDAAHRDLVDLSAETSRLAAAAREGSLGPADYEGGTFSVSALGAFGVDAFTPVINPPNVGILGIGRLRNDLALVDGEVSVTKRLTLSLTWDHRVIDGVPAAEYCRTVVELLADPAQLD